MRFVIGIKCRMKDGSEGIYNRNGCQGSLMGFFEWLSKDFGFYLEDGGKFLMGDLTGYYDEGEQEQKALELLSPFQGPVAIIQIQLLGPEAAEHKDEKDREI